MYPTSRTHVNGNDMYFEKDFNVIMPPCAQGTVLYQNIFPNRTVPKYIYDKLHGVGLYKSESTPAKLC